MQPFTIAGSDAGLQTNKKPFLLPDKAFPVLENAYVWRDRVVKRKGLKLLGRLQRNDQTFAAYNTYNGYFNILGAIGESPQSLQITNITNASQAQLTYNMIGVVDYAIGDYVKIIVVGGMTQINNRVFKIINKVGNVLTLDVDTTTYGAYIGGTGIVAKVTSANIIPGVSFVDGPNTFTDPSLNGRLVGNPAGFGFIDYTTGIAFVNPDTGVIASGTFSYYPGLPVMGIWQREIPSINDEQTIFWDTKYAYIFDSASGKFQEYTATLNTWSGTDSDFFWATNWRGSTPESRLFFATNFVNNSANAMRYTSGGAWTAFAPVLTDNPPSSTKTYLTQARILIPYYGRLLALNVWESPDNAGSPDYGSGVNIFNRCRYSQIGDPTGADAWRSDLFGKGGFIDAPTSEQIVSAVFFKNTLIVYFERTTWQLRYVGDYGIPFIWERISSDFGSESTFSPILFDQGVAAVGDRAITSSTAISADRIDLAIPDFVFDFRNALKGPERVVGVRDFRNEIVYWCYNGFNSDAVNQKFPNHVLVYNYRNNTYATFRDNVTFFGTFQSATSITWDSETILWDDEGVTWDDPENQSLYPAIVSGNQHGFVHYYNDNTPDDPSLDISGIDLTTTPIRLTIFNHNLDNGEAIYLTGLQFLDPSSAPAATDLNDKIYRAIYIDDNTIGLMKWNFTNQQYINNFSFTPTSANNYVGYGKASLFPKLDVQTKDFNPYMNKGGQTKLAYVDFLTDATPSAVMTVNVYANTQVGDPSVRANILVGNRKSETYLTSPYYSTPTSDIVWHRFYCTLAAQFIRLQFTYDDDLMNTLTTHQQTWVLNAITLWTRPGGKIIF